MDFGGAPVRRQFDELYSCYPGAFHGNSEMEQGDKIILPESALEALARLDVEYPMLFQLKNKSNGNVTHCGVLQFSAPEGNAFVPYWMMSNLMLPEGGLIQVKNVSLPKATYVKFQAQSVDFLDINNPRAVLEYTLRSFSCVTKGDQLCIPYNNKKYYLEVKEVKPADAACIIECDCKVDFDAPVGYKEPEPAGSSSNGASGAAGLAADPPRPNLPAPQKAKVTADTEPDQPNFTPFTTPGQRIDGKKLKPSQMNSAAEQNGAGGGVDANSAAVTGGSDGGGGGGGGHWGDGRQLSSGKVMSADERRAHDREKRLAALGGGASSSSSLASSSSMSTGGGGGSRGATKWSKTKKITTFAGSGHRLS